MSDARVFAGREITGVRLCVSYNSRMECHQRQSNVIYSSHRPPFIHFRHQVFSQWQVHVVVCGLRFARLGRVSRIPARLCVLRTGQLRSVCQRQRHPGRRSDRKSFAAQISTAVENWFPYPDVNLN